MHPLKLKNIQLYYHKIALKRCKKRSKSKKAKQIANKKISIIGLIYKLKTIKLNYCLLSKQSNLISQTPFY